MISTETVAIHEAGHAVIGIRQGFALRNVVLSNRGGAHVAPRPRQSGYECQDILAALAAGAIAEDITGQSPRRLIARGAGEDLLMFRDTVRVALSRSRRTDMTVLDVAALAWARAFDLVVEHYGAIVAVAEALLTSSRALTGVQVRRIADSAEPIRPPAVREDGREFWPPEFSRLRWDSRQRHELERV